MGILNIAKSRVGLEGPTRVPANTPSSGSPVIISSSRSSRVVGGVLALLGVLAFLYSSGSTHSFASHLGETANTTIDYPTASAMPVASHLKQPLLPQETVDSSAAGMPSLNPSPTLAGTRLPFYRDSDGLCGNGKWLSDYATVHKTQRSKRVLVSVGVNAGIGDRLSGTVSEFFWAVITQRAFVVTSYADGTIPRWDVAVRPPPGGIDWHGEETEWPLNLSETLHYLYNAGPHELTDDDFVALKLSRQDYAQYFMVCMSMNANIVSIFM